MDIKQEVRSLQRLGGSLALYLPKDWCDRNKLDKGSRVIIKYGERFLAVEIDRESKQEATVDLDDILNGDLKYVLISLYVLGFDKVRLVSKKRISLTTRRFILSLLGYTPGFEIIDEGENFVNIAITHEVEDPAVALHREINSASTVFKYTIEALERAPNIPEEYIEALEELDGEVDRAWFEVERAIYKNANRSYLKPLDVKTLIHLLLVSRYLERLSDHLVQLIREAADSQSQQPDLVDQVRALSATYQEVTETFVSSIHMRETTKNFYLVVRLVDLVENKKSFRHKVVPKLRKEGGILTAYHIMRIYDYMTDIAEVAMNVIVDNIYK